MNLYKEYKKLIGNNVVLSFKGEVSTDLANSILDVIHARLDKYESNLRLRKKVFNVLVETLQNLSRHLEKQEIVDDSLNPRTAIIYIWMDDKGYHVATGNYILTENVASLEDWLGNINSMQKDKLREFYKDTLDNTVISKKGGAGLGFIDIARKSGNELNYEFVRVNDEYSFFSFLTTITTD